MSNVDIRHFHLFAGLGGGARGFNAARAQVGQMRGHFRCIGGIDVDPAGMADFQRLAGVRGTVMDLFDHSQYVAFHGHQPPAGWREATPQDIQRAAGGERPNIVFLSAPCKGFSGLLSETKSKTDKYKALNRLTLRAVWLALEAWKDDPVELFVFENVPRIATRGRPLLDQIGDLFRAFNYAWRETTHDCGEIGNLAQSRKRFLGVARHLEKVPAFLYEPEKKPLRAVGELLSRMPLPGDILRAGPMHRIPALQWKTWVRLALVRAGNDWRSLNDLAIQDGYLRDFVIMPAVHAGLLGVNHWDSSMGTITSRGLPNNGAFAVADPRHTGPAKHSNEFAIVHWAGTARAVTSAHGTGQAVADPRFAADADRHKTVHRVTPWGDLAGTVTSGHGPSSGGGAVADPRMNWGAGAHEAKLRVTDWLEPHKAVTGARGPYSGAVAVADPRGGPDPDLLHGKYHITAFDQPAHAVIAGNANGAFAVADPRPGMVREKGDAYLTGGHYGVVPFSASCGAVSASACHDNGPWAVADPRYNGIGGASGHNADAKQGEYHWPPMPLPSDKLVCRIQALDGTWHRPFTTLELAVLQSLVDPEEKLELDGLSDQAWRERIGNAVPSAAATAIAEVMGETLLLAWGGETFSLSAKNIWVRDVAVALAVQGV